jgi:ATP-dependent helicase/nuclease subunit B
MRSFIQTVLVDLKEKKINFEDVQFILPSKRAGIFLKNQLSSLLEQPIFSPQILSIEEFVEELSGLKKIPNTDLLFRLYSSYKSITKESEQEPFDSFSKWAQILLQDFNEIDRFLVPHEYIFDYLNAIKELNHWSLDQNQTDLVKNHLKFWKQLKTYYLSFTDSLLQNGLGYQGLIYREAAENLETYIESNSHKNHIFLGFNALNEAESRIIQGLLQSDIADAYWDVDESYVNDKVHDAGLFIRNHRKKWNYYKNHAFNWLTNHYSEKKQIEVIGTPKLIGQAKQIGNILEAISKSNPTLANVAVVLGEENLLIPVLNSLPNSVEKLNVTMGLPLKYVPLASLFDQLFYIHKKNTNKYYFKDVISIISHPLIQLLFQTDGHNESDILVDYIQKNNIVYLSNDQLKDIVTFSKNGVDILFKPWEDSPNVALNHCSELILNIKNKLNANKQVNQLELEYLYRFNVLFNKLKDLNISYRYLNSIAALHVIYKELLSSETLDFKGEPLEGLQVMGMLESRVLDFETVIISSVNEGILPSGKSNNSFIPFDVKIENNLPTFKEKDAVYTYHFYRLLQRAKTVYILYNTEVDTLKGGEKSRFITQLEIENIHHINQRVISPDVPVVKSELQQIIKTPEVLIKLKEIALKGFSPSSLSNYIRNPIDFYYEKILGVKEFEDVEENIAANTLGSVIHNTLEDFYKPLEGEQLTLQHLKAFKGQVENSVTKHFKNLYNKGDFSKGKNLIIFEIAQRYIHNFLNTEIELLEKGNVIEIIAIETEENIRLNIPNLNFPVNLKGKVDRVDKLNEVTRIIDYKTGKVEQSKVEIINWEDLTTDYIKYSKSFQVLCYAYMAYKNRTIELPVEAGIISFKNLNEGFLKFGKKESKNTKSKIQLITEETLNNFEKELNKLAIEICSPNINFTEKEVDNDYR